jgi:hypothetical protein
MALLSPMISILIQYICPYSHGAYASLFVSPICVMFLVIGGGSYRLLCRESGIGAWVSYIAWEAFGKGIMN